MDILIRSIALRISGSSGLGSLSDKVQELIERLQMLEKEATDIDEESAILLDNGKYRITEKTRESLIEIRDEFIKICVPAEWPYTVKSLKLNVRIIDKEIERLDIPLEWPSANRLEAMILNLETFKDELTHPENYGPIASRIISSECRKVRSQGDGWKITTPNGSIEYRPVQDIYGEPMNEVWWVERAVRRGTESSLWT
jgi:hypothetical protein